jgi:hypothetical protein
MRARTPLVLVACIRLRRADDLGLAQSVENLAVEPAEFEAAFAEMAAKAHVAVSEASRQRQGTAQSRSGGPR